MIALGGGPSPPSGPAGQPSTQVIDLTTTNNLLQALLNLTTHTYGRGQRQFAVELITLTTGGTFQRMYANQHYVTDAIIQNISAEQVTLTGPSQGTAGQGILLNQYDSLPVGSVDLFNMYFVRASSGVTLAVYVEN